MRGGADLDLGALDLGARVVVLAAVVGVGLGAGCVGTGDVGAPIIDLELAALIDTNGNGLSHDDAVTTTRLSDHLAARRPGTRVLMVNAAAGWCEPCQREAAALPAFEAEYGPRGVAILTAVFQDPAGAPCDEAFARLWAQTFSLPIPVLIDTQFQTGAYFQASVMPANLFVDAETGEILLIATGAEPGADPLRAYRDFLDSHLAR
jgi:thiol-disulfide isomerase/thioredoxin